MWKVLSLTVSMVMVAVVVSDMSDEGNRPEVPPQPEGSEFQLWLMSHLIFPSPHLPLT